MCWFIFLLLKRRMFWLKVNSSHLPTIIIYLWYRWALSELCVKCIVGMKSCSDMDLRDEAGISHLWWCLIRSKYSLLSLIFNKLEENPSVSLELFNTTVAVIGKPTSQKQSKQSITFLIRYWILFCRDFYMLYYREEHCIKKGSILIYKLHIFCKASHKK